VKTVDVADAGAQLSRIIEEVGAGATIVITEDGIPVAHLVPAPVRRQLTVDETIDQIEDFEEREQIDLGGMSIRELIEEGRR
jgi:prevent-host-death family protein